MAGDWIKMRVGLRRHPKIVRMASALKADKLRIVGALHSVWGLFDEHSTDGRLPGYSLEVLDDDLAFPGFGQALVDVQWLAITDDGLEMPRFDAHNGQSAKRRAQDADRKRLERQSSASQADAHPDAGVTREEERREEESSSLRSEDSDGGDAAKPNVLPHSERQQPAPMKQTRGKPAAVIEMAVRELVLPGWLSPHAEAWGAYQDLRWKKNSKAPYTKAAQDGILRELKKAYDQGSDVTELLMYSVTSGYTGVFPDRFTRRSGTGPTSRYAGAAAAVFGRPRPEDRTTRRMETLAELTGQAVDLDVLEVHGAHLPQGCAGPSGAQTIDPNGLPSGDFT